MDVMQRFSFRAQVLTCFAMILLVLGVSSWIGLGKAVTLGAKVETLTADLFVRYELLSSMLDGAARVNRAARGVLAAPDGAARAEALSGYRDAWIGYNDAARTLDAIPAPAEVLAMRRAAREAAERVAALHQQAFEAPAGDPAQRLLALELATRAPLDEWLEAIAGNRGGVQARVRDIGDAARTTASQARTKNLAGSLAGLLVALLGGGWLLLVVQRLIGGDLRVAQAGVEAVGKGNLDQRLPVRPGDSVSIMARIEAMRNSLRLRAETDARLLTALDKAPSGVMIADVDDTIVYANATVRTMLEAVGPAVREIAPNVDVRNLVGTSIDAFHRRPEHQRALVAGLTGEHRARITLGASHFALAVSPALDGEGRRVGTVVGWTDLTAEIALEQEIARVTAAASAGDLDLRVAEDGRSGPQLVLARSMNALLDAVRRSMDELRTVMAALARGDLTVRSEADLSGAFGELRDAANATAEQLNAVLSGIRRSASEVLGAAGEIAQGNDDLSRRTETQAANLEETAASMEELTATVRSNADYAVQAAQLAQSATAQAQSGCAAVARLSASIDEIAAASARVRDITATIDGIAFQTNILALNAAVEAARAGDAGRGFAVVASEIRALAQRCGVASKEIRGLIEQSGQRVAGGAREAGEAGATMQQLLDAVRRVNDLMAEISAASAEQAAGIGQVNQTVVQLDEGTQQNAALVEEASAAAASLRQQAGDLDLAIGRFVLAGGVSQASPPASATAPLELSTPSSAVAGARAPRASATPRRRAEATPDLHHHADSGTRLAGAHRPARAPEPRADDGGWKEF